MKRLFLGLFLFGIAGLAFSFEVQIPMYFVHANNFLSGTMKGSYNDMTIVEMDHDENVFGMGGGFGFDFYFKKRSFFFGDGIYLRANYYKPYHVKTSNTKIKTLISSPVSFSDSEGDINGHSVDVALGSILRYKSEYVEIPLVFAWNFRMSEIDMVSGGKERTLDVGLLIDLGLRIFFTGTGFVVIGARYGVGFGFGGFPDVELPAGAAIIDTFSPSQIVAGYAGFGIRLKSKDENNRAAPMTTPEL